MMVAEHVKTFDRIDLVTISCVLMTLSSANDNNFIHT